LQFALPALGQPALGGHRLQVAPREHRVQAIADDAAEPDELDAVTNEFARLAQRGRGNPDGGQEIAAQQQGEPLGIDAIILEARGGDGFGLLGMREDRIVPEVLEEIDEPPPSRLALLGDRLSLPRGPSRRSRRQLAFCRSCTRTAGSSASRESRPSVHTR
jgi:hypothetical protein